MATSVVCPQIMHGIRVLLICLAMGLVATPGITNPNPEQDKWAFRQYFADQFPQLVLEDFSDGAAAIDAAAKQQQEMLRAFPPYEFELARGRELYQIPFTNGSTYANCLTASGRSGRQHYPYVDGSNVITLELAINRCRQRNGLAQLDYGRGDLAALSAHIAAMANGAALATDIQGRSSELAAYAAGKEFFYTRRGRLDFACASCHQQAAGKALRAITLSPALGQPTHWPAYRLEWGELGTLHRRFAACSETMGAAPIALQSVAYRNLELFLSYMSQGLRIEAPGIRR